VSKRWLQKSKFLVFLRKFQQFILLLLDAVNSAIISPDSQIIICACDNSIQAFNIESLTSLSPIEYKYSVPIELLAMSSDLRYLVASRVDRSILLFNFMERRELYHFKDAHHRKINGIAINKNLIASCSQDKSIKLFDVETHQLVHHFINPDNRILSIILYFSFFFS